MNVHFVNGTQLVDGSLDQLAEAFCVVRVDVTWARVETSLSSPPAQRYDLVAYREMWEQGLRPRGIRPYW